MSSAFIFIHSTYVCWVLATRQVLGRDIFLHTCKNLQVCPISPELQVTYYLTTKVSEGVPIQSLFKAPPRPLAPRGDRLPITKLILLLGKRAWVTSCAAVLGWTPRASFPFPSSWSSGYTHSRSPMVCTGGLLLWGMFPRRCHLWFLFHRHRPGWNVTEALHLT